MKNAVFPDKNIKRPRKIKQDRCNTSNPKTASQIPLKNRTAFRKVTIFLYEMHKTDGSVQENIGNKNE